MGEAALGSVIDRKYRLVAALGQGAMGVVYRAEQLDVEGQARRQVALKTLRPEFSTDVNFTRRFLQEIGVAMQLRSPRIVTVYDCGKDEQGQLYYAMELLPQTLKDWVTEHGPLAVEQVVQIIEQICEGLAEAHGLAEPVVHRDLKPANIFVEYRQEQLEVKIGDFGIAKVVGEQTSGLTHSGAVSPGTPRYMAPEQWKGDAVDGRTDLYALGVMFHELLTGRPPFTGSGSVSVLMAQHLQHPPLPLPESIPEHIRGLVLQLLAKTPAARPADALSVKRALAATPQDTSNIATALLQPDHKGMAPSAEANTRIATPEVPQAQRDSGADRFQSPLYSPRLKFFGRIRRAHWLSVAGLFLIVGTLVTLRYLPFLHLLLSPPRPLAPNTEPGLPTLPLPDKSSLIVLPFANLSNDPSQDYFSDGITEDITTDLSRLSSLFVISRNSAFTYKGKATKVQEVSREMGVRYVLEGSVRRTDNQIRITAQLIDATTDHHLWAERYDRPLKDIFAVQDEIVQQIVTTLNLQLTLMERGVSVRKQTNNLEAYDAFLRGTEAYWHAYFEMKKAELPQARQMFEKAIELDPQYAQAYAGLGWTYWLEWFGGSNPQTLERAGELAQKALTLDETLPAAHSLLGTVYLWKKQFDQAITEAKRVVALDSNNANGYVQLGGFFSLAGRAEEAISLIEKAMRLNPRYPPVYVQTLSTAYRMAGRYEEALVPGKKAAALLPNWLPAHANLAFIYSELGRLEEARAEVEEMRRFNPNVSLELFKQTLPYKDPAVVERHVEALRKAGLK